MQVDSIYFDFSKAFDTVNHSRLLEKVWNVGVRGTLFRWLKSYLLNRTQSVRACGAESYSFSSSSGVPQGSNLGPLLFCIFINDISLELTACKILLYAEDAKVFFVIRDIGILLCSSLKSTNFWVGLRLLITVNATLSR